MANIIEIKGTIKSDEGLIGFEIINNGSVFWQKYGDDFNASDLLDDLTNAAKPYVIEVDD